MAVGKASLKRAAKAAETEVKTEKPPVSEKEASEKNRNRYRDRCKGTGSRRAGERKKGGAVRSETEEEQRFQKDKSRSRNICSSGKNQDNTEKKTDSSQNSRNQNNRSKS